MAARDDTILAFDVGGHGARAGLIDARTGTLVRQADVPAGRAARAAAASDRFAQLLGEAAEALGESRPARVVIAAPGPVVRGSVSRLPTLFPGAEEPVDLIGVARSLWPDAAAWACNDLTAAGYAFVARGHRDFLVVTCGSGIGAKLFVGGEPMLGGEGMGGEIGHWRVPGAPPVACDCGGTGHLGALASGRGALRLARHAAGADPGAYARSALARACPDPEALDARRLARAFREGDGWAGAIVEQAAAALGSALALAHLATAVDLFFVTGGFGTALGPAFGARLAAAARRSCWATGIDWDAAIRVAEPGVEWGLIGAAQLALRRAPDRAPGEALPCA